MNRVSLVGRLTANPELRYTSGQQPYTRFTIAIDRTYKNVQGEKETDFIGIIAWRKQAENICNYLDKGSLVSVGGRIQTGTYTDKEGNKKYSFDVVADNVQFLETRAQAEIRRKSERVNVQPNNNIERSPYDYQDNNNQGVTIEKDENIYMDMGDLVDIDVTTDEID